MKMRSIFWFYLLLLLPVFATAQDAPEVTLANPYNTLYSHLYYLQPDSYRPDLAAKVIYNVPDSAKAQKLAIQIKQILDGKGLYVPLKQAPTNPNFLDSTSRKHIYTIFPDELPEIYLERIDSLWYYSTESIEAVPSLHKKVYPFGADFLVKLVPQSGNKKFLGLALWQYAGIGLLLIFAVVFQLLFSRILNPLITRLSRSRLYPSLISKQVIWKLARLISIWILFQIIRSIIPVLQLPIEASQAVVIGLRLVLTLIAIFIGLRILDMILLYAGKLTENTENKLDDQLMPIVKRSVQAVIILIGIINILRLLDVNVTALIAGISIGGLALALAAQDTVKNLIGSAVIFIDRPFQIGDWIIGSGFEGSVVEVGFRTTRIQSLDSSIIAVPNGTIANMAIRNLGVRAYRLFNIKLGITYDTPPGKIEEFMAGLKEVILQHEHAQNEGYYVHLSEMADSSINILFRAVLDVPDYATELKSKEELYLAILRLAEEKGVDFAFPSTSVYIEGMQETGSKKQD